MSHYQKHIVEVGNKKYHYLVFDSVLAFNSFVDKEANVFSGSNSQVWESIEANARKKLERTTHWYGNPIPQSIAELQHHSTFLGMDLIKKIQPKIKNRLYKYLEYLQSSVLPKPKISYNDKGLGVFSFERAAMTMYKAYPLNTQSPISTSISQMHIELGHRKIHTRTKNVYAYFKDQQLSYPSVQLYVMAGANINIKGNELLYVGLACSELITYLEARNIPVEVNVMLGTSFEGKVVMGVVRVKRFQDSLDKNQLLLMSSDPRYFRYRGFKSLIALSNYFDLDIPEGLGQISLSMGQDFVDSINPKGFVFEQSYSMDSSIKEVTTILENYKKQLKL